MQQNRERDEDAEGSNSGLGLEALNPVPYYTLYTLIYPIIPHIYPRVLGSLRGGCRA